jgi:porin
MGRAQAVGHRSRQMPRTLLQVTQPNRCGSISGSETATLRAVMIPPAVRLVVSAVIAVALGCGTEVAAAGAPAAANHGVPTERAPTAEQTAVPPAELPPGIERDYAEYLVLKEQLRSRYGLDYWLDLTLMPQWTAAKGAVPIGLFAYTPTINWTPFTDSALGSGRFAFSFQQNRFWTGRNITALQERVGFLSAPNDWFRNLRGPMQLTYTHTLPHGWNWLSTTVGQYSFGRYDTNDYAGNALTNFINYALAQNGTQAYVGADLGAYVQAAGPDQQWLLAAGFQGADNLTGQGLSTRGLASGKTANFAAARLTPSGWGGTYGLLWYFQPATPAQPSRSQGISFSATQELGAGRGVFLRVNTASGLASPIAVSVAWGVVEDDPTGRGRSDQIGLGFGWNNTNLKAVGRPARSAELVVELYANCAVSQAFKIGPDIQVYPRPALAARSGPAAVFTIRGTASF